VHLLNIVDHERQLFFALPDGDSRVIRGSKNPGPPTSTTPSVICYTGSLTIDDDVRDVATCFRKSED